MSHRVTGFVTNQIKYNSHPDSFYLTETFATVIEQHLKPMV